MEDAEFDLPRIWPFESEYDSCSCSGTECQSLNNHAEHLFEQTNNLRESLSRRMQTTRELREAVYLTTQELVSVFEKLGDKESAFINNMESIGRTAALYDEKNASMIVEEQRLITCLISEIKACDKLQSELNSLEEEKVELEGELSRLTLAVPTLLTDEQIAHLESTELPELRAEKETLEKVYLQNCSELDETESKLPGLYKQISSLEESLNIQSRIEQYLHARQSVDYMRFFKEFEKLTDEETELQLMSKQVQIQGLVGQSGSYTELKE